MRTTRENALLLPGIPIPDEIRITGDLHEAMHAAEMVVTAVPAQEEPPWEQSLTSVR